MSENSKPIIYKTEDDIAGLKQFQEDLFKHASQKEQDVLLQFPIVYIHNWQDKNDYEVYIGESNSIMQRTKQHYTIMSDETKWQHQLAQNKGLLYIVGHEHFNKSLTLDIENRLRLYMMSAERVRKVHNARGNPQNRYYPDTEMDHIFQMIWSKLHRDNKDLFPSESSIKDSAIFKASPLHKLTLEQEQIKETIIERIYESLASNKTNQLIFIEGEAGTGKTVLNSSTFYELFAKAEEQGGKPISCYMMVNHDEQITVYSQIAQKLGLIDRYGEVVCKPTSFINHHTVEEPVDVAFIDEAHLLLTQGKQSYQGDNQLQDIINRAKVTVVMFDENQILTTEQYWEAEILNKFRKQAKEEENYFVLKNQLRMKAPKEVIDWIDNFTKKQVITNFPNNLGGYEIRIFNNPELLEQELKEKAKCEEHKLSRLVATYDWDYNNKDKMESRLSNYWEVKIGKWHKPWNRELEKELSRKEKRGIKSLSWAEQPQTIDEVGSTFTIQGFDLNYVGVILGPSVKYRNGKVVFDPSEKNYKKMTQKRTLSDGTKKQFAEQLIQHEVRVLMTRGVEGVFIYACDEELRKALLMVSEGRI